MSNPRFTGLLLLLTGVLVLMGNTMDVLPPEAFWAGLMTYPIGGYLFFIGSRRAIDRAETRHAQKLNPRLANDAGEAHARLQERSAPNPNAPETALPSFQARPPAAEIESEVAAAATSSEPLALHELPPEDETEDFEVGTDVSFPIEVQEQRSIADQLEKLSRLQEQGIISAEEYAVAKAKLLG